MLDGASPTKVLGWIVGRDSMEEAFSATEGCLLEHCSPGGGCVHLPMACRRKREAFLSLCLTLLLVWCALVVVISAGMFFLRVLVVCCRCVVVEDMSGGLIGILCFTVLLGARGKLS